MSLTPAERKARARIAANDSWAQTQDRPARTAKARKALEDKFLTEAGGDPKRAESLRKAYYARLAFKSAKARRLRKEASDAVQGGDGNAA
jgi:hypothetical protein